MRRNEPILIGRLMMILSVKNWEVPEFRRLKACVVFRGDDIRDQNNKQPVLQKAKVNPSGLVGTNANLAYGRMNGNTTSGAMLFVFIPKILSIHKSQYALNFLLI